MNRIKLFRIIVSAAAVCVLLSACSNNDNAGIKGANADAVYAEYTELRPDENGTVTILTEGITRTARFFNYYANGVTVQLVALRDRKDDVHIAFNTCQSCSPSPKAYYRQSGDLLQCTNCGFTFEPEQVGVTAGGCNLWPIDDVSVGENEIIIPVSSLDDMRSTFTSWAGPKK